MAARSSQLLARARASNGEADETTDQILTAARKVFSTTGFRKATMDDVANEAGFGRATVYRKFANKEALVEAVFVAELQEYLAAIDAATEKFDSIGDQMAEGFWLTLQATRSSSTLGTLLELEGDWGLSYVTDSMTPVIAAAREYLASKIRAAQRKGEASADIDPELAAEVIVRMCHSLLLTPDGLIPHDDPRKVRQFARDYLMPILTGR